MAQHATSVCDNDVKMTPWKTALQNRQRSNKIEWRWPNLLYLFSHLDSIVRINYYDIKYGLLSGDIQS